MQDMIQEMIQDMILLYIAWKCLECVLRVTFSMMSILLLSEFWVDLVQPSHLVLFQRPGPHLTTDLHDHSHWFAQILHVQGTAIVAPQIDTLTRRTSLGNQLPTGAGVPTSHVSKRSKGLKGLDRRVEPSPVGSWKPLGWIALKDVLTLLGLLP